MRITWPLHKNGNNIKMRFLTCTLANDVSVSSEKWCYWPIIRIAICFLRPIFQEKVLLFFFFFSWHAQSELVFILEFGRTRNCARLLLDVISRLEFWWHNMITVFAIYFSFMLILSSLANINGETTNQTAFLFQYLFCVIWHNFLELILAQIMRHKDDITSYLHSAFSSEDYRAEAWKTY